MAQMNPRELKETVLDTLAGTAERLHAEANTIGELTELVREQDFGRSAPAGKPSVREVLAQAYAVLLELEPTGEDSGEADAPGEPAMADESPAPRGREPQGEDEDYELADDPDQARAIAERVADAIAERVADESPAPRGREPQGEDEDYELVDDPDQARAIAERVAEEEMRDGLAKADLKRVGKYQDHAKELGDSQNQFREGDSQG